MEREDQGSNWLKRFSLNMATEMVCMWCTCGQNCKTQTTWKQSSEVQWSAGVKRVEQAQQRWNPCHMSLMNIHRQLMFMHQAVMDQCKLAVNTTSIIGSRALSFSDPYFHFTCLSVLLSFCHSVCLSATSELNISETRPDSGMVTIDGLYKLAYGLSIGHTPDDVT